MNMKIVFKLIHFAKEHKGIIFIMVLTKSMIEAYSMQFNTSMEQQ